MKLILLFSFVIIISLVLSVSCVNKEVPVTETYYETEYRQEPYTTTESYENKISHKGDNLLSQSNGGWTYILLNRASNRSINWAVVTALSEYPAVRSLPIQPSGENQRISVSLIKMDSNKLLSCSMANNRSPEGIKLGFKPKALPPDYSERISDCKRYYPFMTHDDCVEAVTGGASSSFDFMEGGRAILRAYSADFSFDELFNTSGWELIHIMSGSSYSVDYMWDEVQIETREVTKYNNVPVQVQKQRTVMQIKKVPFWEAIFSE